MLSHNEYILKYKRAVKIKKASKKTLMHLIMILLSLVFLIPFFYMFFMAFMTTQESVGLPEIVFFPTQWVATNFSKAFNQIFIRAFFNTIIIIGADAVIVPLMSSFCAYGFARCKFPGKDFLFAVTLSTMMLPAIVTQIPLYTMFYRMNWLNTPLPFIIPCFFGGGAAGIFLVRQFIRTLPRELDEAAFIDGANRFYIYWRIILPLCFPVLIFLIIGVFNGYWNNFEGPLMYLRREDSWTLPLAIFKKYTGVLSADNFPSFQMATGLIMAIPPAVFFFIFQKHIIDGVVLSGIKG